MIRRTFRRGLGPIPYVALMLAVVAVLAACSSNNPDSLGPTEPGGATPIPGGAMTDVPTPAEPKVPTSQQEAQDTVLGYLQKTVDGLPPGTTLDSTNFRGAANRSCDDEYTGPGRGPTRFSVWTHVVGPQDASPEGLVAQAGDLWRSWGLTVIERDDFRKPNRFGYPPDGYELQIKGAGKPGYPPTLIASSLCFPGDLARDNFPFPQVIRQSHA